MPFMLFFVLRFASTFMNNAMRAVSTTTPNLLLLSCCKAVRLAAARMRFQVSLGLQAVRVPGPHKNLSLVLKKHRVGSLHDFRSCFGIDSCASERSAPNLRLNW